MTTYSAGRKQGQCWEDEVKRFLGIKENDESLTDRKDEQQRSNLRTSSYV